MKIKSLFIEKYKNIINQTFDFSESNNYTLLIGGNGSGKSNLLEAISIIFAYLYNNSRSIDFNYQIIFEIDGKEYKRTKRALFIDNIKVTKVSDIVLPNKVIACYSGEDNRLWKKVYEHFYMRYFNKVINNISQELVMIYINKYSWEIALISLMCSEKENVKKFLSDILGIEDLSSIKINFTFNTDNYQKYEVNEVIKFINRINEDRKTDSEKYMSEIATYDLSQRTNEEYCLMVFKYLYIASQPKQNEINKLDKIITSINITFKDFSFSDLSEGEKKLILIQFINNILCDDNSLVLYDEPDAHVHVENKQKLLKSITSNQTKSHIILSTHSPTIAMNVACKDSIINMWKGDNNNVEWSKGNEEIVSKITSNLWHSHEGFVFLNTKKHIILVEGKYDKIYIDKAKLMLSPKYDDLNFEIFPVGGVDSFMHFGVDKLRLKPGQKIICYLDKDPISLDDDDENNNQRFRQTKLEQLSKYFNIQNSNRNEFMLSQQIIFKFYPNPKNPDGLDSWLIEDFFDKSIIKPLYIEFAQKRFDNIENKNLINWSNIVNNNCKSKKYISKFYLTFPNEAYRPFEKILDDIKQFIS